MGLLFASIYTLIGAIQAGYWNSLGPTNLLDVAPYTAFFNASRPTLPSDFIYYSYTTLSTVGYGDLTATSALGRILSTTEALIGQLYLVTVVAILVGKMQAVRLDPSRGGRLFQGSALARCRTPGRGSRRRMLAEDERKRLAAWSRARHDPPGAPQTRRLIAERTPRR